MSTSAPGSGIADQTVPATQSALGEPRPEGSGGWLGRLGGPLRRAHGSNQRPAWAEKPLSLIHI